MNLEAPTDFARCRAAEPNILPLIVEPNEETEVEPLVTWLRDHTQWVQAKIVEHGALLLRGFSVRDPARFEAVCRAISPSVSDHWVGTPSTRLAPCVYPSSEGPTMYPIPQHCELMYLPKPPERIFFGCLVPPEAGSGETPLVDNRRVWRDLDPVVRDRFVRGGLRIVRNLCGPNSRFRLWTQVRWDDFFVTTDRAEVEAQCRRAQFDFEWTHDDGLRLVIEQPVTRDHPVSGETAWCNQLLSYDVTSTADDFRRLYRIRPSPRLWRMWQFVRLTAQLKARSPASTLVARCTYSSGAPIPKADTDALRDAVWRNLAHFAWHTGDVVAIDNFATAHGRFPAWGPRQIVACMA